MENLENILGHNGQIVLLFFDIDRLLTFNDAYNHNLGDQKIIEIGREIETLCGSSARVFRWGGDEFGAILYEASLEMARQIAEKIRAGRQPVPVVREGRKEVATLTLSIGIAHFPTQAHDSQSLIETATSALYKAKDGGQLSDGTRYIGRNHVMAIGDFLED